MAEGLGNTAIARRLVITDGALHTHIRSIFAKLDLAPHDEPDRRVVAVLRSLHEPSGRRRGGAPGRRPAHGGGGAARGGGS